MVKARTAGVRRRCSFMDVGMRPESKQLRREEIERLAGQWQDGNCWSAGFSLIKVQPGQSLHSNTDPVTAPRPSLSVHHLRFQRSDRVILDNVDWTVAAGEHWVILGPNGCGKTSLINCLTGYEMSTAGEITVDGAEYGRTDWREVRKRVGLVTSTLTFYLEPGEPVLDAVVSGREAMLNLVGQVDVTLYEEARKLLERIGCGHLINSRWGVLSQGERQKILICRALIANFHV